MGRAGRWRPLTRLGPGVKNMRGCMRRLQLHIERLDWLPSRSSLLLLVQRGYGDLVHTRNETRHVLRGRGTSVIFPPTGRNKV